MSEHDQFDDDYVSKSQVKRELKQLTELGETIAKLPKSTRDSIPLPDELAEAMVLADKIQNKREAWRRHINYIGKLMRAVDIEPIEDALSRIQNKHHSNTVFFHRIEQLRDKLLAEGDQAINDVIAMNREIDRPKLRQLVRKAKKEQQSNQPPKAYRELFKYLRDQLEE